MEVSSDSHERKSSVELEMEEYLEAELGRKEFCSRNPADDSNLPLDLTVPKAADVKSSSIGGHDNNVIPDIHVTNDSDSVDHDNLAVQTLPPLPFTEPFAVPTSNAAAGVATAEVEKTSEPSDRHATDVDLYLSSSTEKAVDGGDDLADKASTAAGGEDSGVDLAKIVGGEPLPNEGVDQTSSHQSGKPEHKLSQPSKIPSRLSWQQPVTLSDDLRKLENRLERYISKTGSEAGSESSEVSDVSGRSSSSVSNVVNRLHNAQTTSSKAKVADPMSSSIRGKISDSMSGSCRGKLPDSMTSSCRGKLPDASANSKTKNEQAGSSPPEKAATGSMLKTTLRKMSRFSISGNKPKKEEEKEKGAQEQKSRGRPSTSTKPSLLSPPGGGVGRSRSFKEPEKPGAARPVGSTINSRNLPYTSSLRRTKNKNLLPEEAQNQTHLQRSGTGGHLERTGIRRSVSATRGGGVGGQAGGGAGRIVKKSRFVQTQLTLDTAGEPDDGGEEAASKIQFQVWLPDLLGEGTDQVQTHVETNPEPVDVRKNRQLTLENMKLQREIERMKAQTTENELLRKELKNVRVKLEEEQKTRMSIERDLENNHERVRTIMAGMESVERKWESKEESFDKLQAELDQSVEEAGQLRGQLNSAAQTVDAQKKELERSLAAQKTLIHQLQEAEAEARELQDFLQAEKNTLAEALRDSELQVKRLKAALSDKDDAVARLEEQSSLLVRRAEQRSQELQSARAELTGMKDRAREMLLAQGAELSRASLAVSQLYEKLEQMAPENYCPNDDQDDSESSESRSDPIELEEVGKARRSSQFLVTPTENLDILSDFSKAMMTASTGSDNFGEIGTSISSLATAIADRKLTEANTQGGMMSVPSLADQINQVSLMLSKLVGSNSSNLLANNINNTRTSNSSHGSNNSLHSRQNGNLDTAFDLENIDLTNMDITRQIIQEQNSLVAKLRLVVTEKDNSLLEMRNKFSRNRQILSSNWQQAEDEVRKLDEIYHDTVNKVLDTLKSIPELVELNPNLANLQHTLEQAQHQEELMSADGLNGNQPSSITGALLPGAKPPLAPKPDLLPKPKSKKSKSESLLSRSLVGESLSSGLQDNSDVMSRSLLIDTVAPAILKAAVLSDPCLNKSPRPNIPAILSGGPRLQDDDELNANQSL